MKISLTFFHAFLLHFIKKKNHCIVDVNRKHAHYKKFKQKTKISNPLQT